MAIKPILFNTEMVKAILDGRKTQTRRLVKPNYHDGDAGFNVVTMANTGAFCYIEYYDEYERSTERRMNPPYNVDDILWVRETWCKWWMPHGEWYYCYKASEREGNKRPIGPEYDDAWETIPWKPSIHMPKDAARIFLRVTDVRVELLQSMSEDDAIAEGASGGEYMDEWGNCVGIEYPRNDFAHIWDRTIKKADIPRYGWETNPWVWVIEFERTEQTTPF